jgi:molybdopterin-guanine dinucleotide biosynthesis protein MobB
VNVQARTSPEPVAIGVVLAGGEAQRMGRDKLRLRLGGASLVARNVALLQTIFPTVAVSVRDPGQITERLPDGIEMLTDKAPGSPLGGIATVLERFAAPVFVLAGDTAFAQRPAIERVLAAFADVDVALPVVEGHLEPLHAAYGPGCLAPAASLLAAGHHSVLDLFPLVRVAQVEFGSSEPFFNVNTPGDWDEARRKLAAVGVVERPADQAEPGGPAELAGPADQAEPDGPAVVGVVGKSNHGKTTLIEKLIPELVAMGLRVGTVKRVARFDVDVPGKDSWRHGRSGVEAYAVASASKLAYVTKLPHEARLQAIVDRFFEGYDVVICEGYRREARHVVEIFRSDAGYGETVCSPSESLALVTDAALSHEHRFGLDEAPRLAKFLVERLGLTGR